MSWKIVLQRTWRALSVLASVFSIGRMFGGLLDMLDYFDQ